jgi:MFS family permease
VSSVFLTQLGQGAFWSLDGVYGRASGLSADSIGFILALSTLVLLVGASGAAWAGERFGLFPALFFLLATNAVSIVLVGTVPVHWVFVAANILQALTNLSSLIYQLGNLCTSQQPASFLNKL